MSCFHRLALLLAMLGVAFPGASPTPLLAQASVPKEDTKLAAAEKEGCIRNLNVIYHAIQRYRADHKDIPNWLSDLVPQYISDANVLICPACKRTGEIESSVLADPKLPCSYLYEFCPVPLGKLPNGLIETRREWKRRQMGLVGSMVPIVRCKHHGVVLNLAFDGRIYESPPSWKDLVTNVVNLADLDPDRLFAADSSRHAIPSAVAPKFIFPPRDPKAKPGLIDLSTYYNATLKEWGPGNLNYDLASLPTGVQNFGGVDFDVRGLIQLDCKAPASLRFPARIDGIRIHQKCARLHFLHAAGFGGIAAEGKPLGRYVLHFAANNMQLEIPIIYGRDVLDAIPQSDEKPADLKAAWTTADGTGAHTRLFTTTWVNVAPAVEIETIDFVSSMGVGAPFLIAITAD